MKLQTISVHAMLWAALSMGLTGALAQGLQPELIPLEDMLNPDGSLNTPPGFSGALDPEGWRMTTDPSGAPRFMPAETFAGDHPADILWDDRFGNPGLPGMVYVLAGMGSKLYAAGWLEDSSISSPSPLATWDGSTWEYIGGESHDGWIQALAVIGNDLYVGGRFMSIGGLSTNSIAKWDGSTWTPLGSGLWDPPTCPGAVHALAVIGTDLYAGGFFSTAGGVAANNIAKWDGNTWSALGSGADTSVFTLAVMGTDLYAGGAFTSAGGVAGTSHVAKWDGTGWSRVGWGFNGYVHSLAVMGTDLYAGGQFTAADTVPASRVAKWNGLGWSALASGMNSGVQELVVIGSDLYAGGPFTAAGGVAASRVARWDGSSWWNLGSGANSQVFCLGVLGEDLYAGGYFSIMGGLRVWHVSKWDGVQWSVLGSGMTNDVTALAVSGANLYAGGMFDRAGGAGAGKTARWNGTSWTGNGSAMDSCVHALAVIGAEIYLGGSFTRAFGAPVNHIVQYNSSIWAPLGTGMNGTVYALAVLGTDLYVGGSFTTAGDIDANRVARWNGTSWFSLGSGMNDTVRALTVIGNDLYAGGCFTTAGGASADRIAKWDGAAWSSLGSGISGGSVYALSGIGSDLYAGGSFTTAGGLSANRIAKWNGQSWSAVGSGMNGNVNSLGVQGTELFAGGDFTEAGSVAANRIAEWNGVEWSPLGSGMDDAIEEVAASGMDIYVGGSFHSAGSKPSFHIARWSAPKTVALFSPNGGEVWHNGLTYPIVWSTNVNDVRLEFSTNNGTTWTDIVVSMPAAEAHYHWTVPPDLSTTEGLIRISDVSEPAVCDTSNAVFGISSAWQTQTTEGRRHLNDVCFINTTTGWVAGNNGTVLFTSDGGATWSSRANGVPPSQPHLNGVNFINDSKGWLAGDGGKILTTTNGGLNWSLQTSVTTNQLNDIDFIDGQRGWTVGNGGTILVTTNGGSTWTSQPCPTTEHLTGVTFTTSAVGWVVGWTGTILKTTNGGAVWNTVPSGTLDNLNDICLLPDQTHGWVVGNNGTILATTDEGASWVSQASGTTRHLNGVSFVSTDLGWAVGNNGVILRYSTGATSARMRLTMLDPPWSVIPSGTEYDLFTVAFLGGTTGVILGDSGTAMQYVPSEVDSCHFGLSVPISTNWNLVSLPLRPEDFRTECMFAGSASPAFGFESPRGYVRCDTLSNRVGYWIKFSESQYVNFCGQYMSGDTIDVDVGWNIVGSVSNPVDTGTIVGIPPDLRGSPWYGYNEGYNPATQIQPGRGYWVRANQGGQFVFGSGTFLASRLASTGIDVSTLNTITISDRNAGSQTLYFGVGDGEISGFLMPPMPPAGGFDARFESEEGGVLVKLHGEAQLLDMPIAVTAEAYPVTIRWSIKGTGCYSIVDVSGNRVITPRGLRGEGSLEIATGDVRRIILRAVDTGGLPLDFALYGNYPNPFNPATTVMYALPVNSHVSLKIYDLLGREVRVLVDEVLEAGYRSVDWNSTNNSGQTVGSGVYFCRLQAGDFVSVRKMLLLK